MVTAWKTEKNDLYIKSTISQNVSERPHNITSILNNLKTLIQPVYGRRCIEKVNIKKRPKYLIHIKFTQKVGKFNYTETEKAD